MLDNIAAPKTIYLKDYAAPDYLIETVDLVFELEETGTIVTSILKVARNGSHQRPLLLNGEQLQLLSVKVNAEKLSPEAYQLTADHLTLDNLPAEFTLEIVTQINPQANTALSGLYFTDKVFCTQCEAEGFRRITYFLDRPDVLARYTTTIIADQQRYPVLLSNGNLIAQQTLPNNRHQVTWQDPFKKPCYLFALVAGDLDCLEDQFTTASGRQVALKIFSDKGDSDKCTHAMEAVKKSMRWDEETYGREYDLDIFMIVAIHSFNMGAMENKGLNIFNAKYILAKPDTATDMDYQNVLAVVGHEYFHNWTGNRVTCRDWFQLSLKEGLTVLREHEFTAAMTSPLVARIENVKHLRAAQFPEDAGPLAHPIQPDAYIEINNFYTMTIYEKGAEVIRMMKTLLGKDLFRKGMDLYFERHDGDAVTIQDFAQAMEDASGRDLTQFKLWYKQAGTPELTVTTDYDQTKQVFTLKIQQACPATPNQAKKKPFHIPVGMALLDAQGKTFPGTAKILELKNEIEVFEFANIPQKPVPSLLRDFSAAVKLKINYSDAELQFLLMHDGDGFNRWNAGQQLAMEILLNNKPATLLIDAWRQLLQMGVHDNAFLAELLTLPSEVYLGEQMAVIDIDAIHHARQTLRKEIAKQLQQEFLDIYKQYSGFIYTNDAQSISNRRLKNVCLSYLLCLQEPMMDALALQQFQQTDNMTDAISALSLLVNRDAPSTETVLKMFYQKWQSDNLVIDKWLAVQACSELPGTLQRVKTLMQHSAFTIKNPNKVRSLIGSFCMNNLVQFHALDGSGYAFLAEQVLVLDKLNPQIAARLLTPLTQWRRYDAKRQNLQRTQLEQIAKTVGISKDVYEIAAKSL